VSTAKASQGNQTITNRTQSFTKPQNYRSQQLKFFVVLPIGKFLEQRITYEEEITVLKHSV